MLFQIIWIPIFAKDITYREKKRACISTNVLNKSLSLPGNKSSLNPTGLCYEICILMYEDNQITAVHLTTRTPTQTEPNKPAHFK